MGKPFNRLRAERDVPTHDSVSVDIVIPVYNEERALPASVPTLCRYLEAYIPYQWSVTIADNASVDRTLEVANELAAEDPRVKVLHLDQKGRGRALKAAWLASEADIVAYMDVDLSTNLSSFMPLIAPLATGHSEVAIGSRLSKGAVVTRQWKREVISRTYNLMIKLAFRNRFSDAQCGFKALTRGSRRVAAAAGGKQPVVLRHRAAAAGRGARSANPRGSGRLGRGCRHAGQDRLDRHGGHQGALARASAAVTAKARVLARKIGIENTALTAD